MNSELPKLTSDEAKQKLEAGEAIEKVFIERLVLAKKNISYPIKLIECEIDHLDLNSSTIEGEVTIRRCEIGMMVASDTVFNNKLDLQNTHLKRGRFPRAQMKGEFNGKDSRLSYVSFHESKFEGKVAFRNAVLREPTFSNTTFQSGALFTESQFQGKANFQESKWLEGANFKRIKALEDLDFQRAHFSKDVLMNGSVIKQSLDFGGATLEGFTDFRDMTLGHSLYLGGVNLGEKQGFRFLNAMAASFILNRDIVEGHVYPEAEGKYRAASREYAFLRSTFQSLNRFDDEDWAYYQFKKLERKGKPFSYNPIALINRLSSYFFLDIGCGYGTKPFRTLAVCGVMILVFALSYFIYFGSQPSPNNYGFESKLINQAIYAMDISLIAFSGGHGDLASMNIRGSIRLLNMVEYLLGVLFMGLFIVTFSRKVIR